MSDEDLRLTHEPEADEAAAAVPEHDDLPGSGRRRRPVADWGGDELFNHVPRRRFARSGVGTHARRPSASPITTHQLRRNADSELGAALRGAESRGPEPGSSTLGGPGPGASLITVHEPEAPPSVGRSWSPERSGAARERRRARRTIDQRVGPRPDRIAALAFVLGMLLVLLAVATADAAALSHF